jgi:hypothetical protein
LKDGLKISSEPRFTFYDTASRMARQRICDEIRCFKAGLMNALWHEIIFYRNDVAISFDVQAGER